MPVKLSVLKLCLRDDFETNTFRIGLADKLRLPFLSIQRPEFAIVGWTGACFMQFLPILPKLSPPPVNPIWETLIATDSLKATRAIYSFLGLNEIFNELKSGDKSLFLRKYFATYFTFNGSAGMNSA